METKQSKNQKNKGFTLIEVIVAVSIFVIVMLVAVGAILNAVDVNRKAQSMNVVVNNLNLAFESMIRDIRTGSGYVDCSTGGNACVSFVDKDGKTVEYSVNEDGLLNRGPQSIEGEGPVTSDEVVLEDVTFSILGNNSSGGDGPERILVHIRGSAGFGKTKSEFNVQTLVTSRKLQESEL